MGASARKQLFCKHESRIILITRCSSSLQRIIDPYLQYNFQFDYVRLSKGNNYFVIF